MSREDAMKFHSTLLTAILIAVCAAGVNANRQNPGTGIARPLASTAPADLPHACPAHGRKPVAPACLTG
jgi:hypothetical protein